MRDDCISLWKFKQVIKSAWKNRGGAKDTKVIFYLDGKEVFLDDIRQFSVIPDVVIHLKESK